MPRSLFRPLHAALVASSLSAAVGSTAFAQETVEAPPLGTEAPAAPPATAEPAAPAPEPAPTQQQSWPAASEPQPPVVSVVVAEPAAPAAPAAPAEAVEEETPPWYDNFSLGAFVDAYGAIRSDSNRSRVVEPPEGTALLGQYPHEAYVTGEGFALAFAGIDAEYSGDKFGATISLRFGPGVPRFYFGDTGPLGIDNITQAFATWRPIEMLSIDIGQFGTLYGAEVLESWRNLNYSRGALYYAMQPFWHTGVRAALQLHDMFAINAMVVNGVNNAFENNKSPSIGLQAVLTPGDAFFLAVGYLGALHPRSEGELFQNFFDVVATLTLGDLKVIGNVDLNMYEFSGAESETFWGVSIAPGYQFTDWLGAALRYEHLSDGANALFGMTDPASGMAVGDSTALDTITATLDLKPVPGSSALIIRPEFRYELSSDDYFGDSDGELTDNYWQAVLGVVVTSME